MYWEGKILPLKTLEVEKSPPLGLFIVIVFEPIDAMAVLELIEFTLLQLNWLGLQLGLLFVIFNIDGVSTTIVIVAVLAQTPVVGVNV